MPTPVPVPSKAAIRALRGLILGTTCSLAVIIEDRRRRINCARRALSNRDRLRASPLYRPGAAAEVIAAKEEEAFLLGSWPFPHRHPGNPDDVPQATFDSKEIDFTNTSNDDGIASLSSQVESSPGLPHIPAATQEKRITITRSRPPLRASFAAQRPRNTLGAANGAAGLETSRKTRPVAGAAPEDAVATRVAAMCRTGDPEDLDAAVHLLLETLQKGRKVLERQLGELLESSALLCRTCQAAGSMENALRVLQAVVRLEDLDEEVYFAHNPLPIVEDTLLRDRDAIAPHIRYKLAVDLFTPTLSGNPSLERPRMLKLCEKLVQAGIDMGRCKLVTKLLFGRLTWYLGEPNASGVVLRVFRRMHEQQMFQAAVRFFLSLGNYYKNIVPDDAEYLKLGDLVVKCVSGATGYKAAEVLMCLLKHRPEEAQLRVSWVCELLYLDWKTHGIYDKTLELFRSLCGEGITKLVSYPDGAYRAIIQIALESGAESAARDHFEELKSFDPRAAKDVRILGLFALERAQVGDWDGVMSLFEQMAESPALATPDGSQTLVPILKVYGDTHSVQETEEFLKCLLQDLKVPLSKYMVTLIGKKYGTVRDVRSFLGWLEFCSAADFKMDAAFSNTILLNCRNHWKFNFMDLRRVHRALQRFGAEFSDGVTDNIMAGAALAAPVTYRRVAMRLAGSTRSRRKPLVSHGRCDPATVSDAMATSIEMGKPGKAVQTYRLAMSSGMTHCPRCLRLYTIASIKLDRDSLGEILHTLQAAQKTGVPIEESITALFLAELETVDDTLGNSHIENHAQNVLRGVRHYGLKMSSSLLNKAAVLYAMAGNHQGAIGLALTAARARGEAPGYNVTNFVTLLDAFMATEQPGEVAELVKTATEFGWWTRMAGRDLNLLKRLKQWRRRLERSMDINGGKIAELEVIETAIETVLDQRRQLDEERRQLAKGALDIVAAAVADARCEPDEFSEAMRSSSWHYPSGRRDSQIRGCGEPSQRDEAAHALALAAACP